ncbi:MAG TPA: hypothetical protein DCE41_19230 [Cytophagales bacterium]|nr:hypothetical protein [Cytophagales bacterium]HAA18082.1 hypothetical protein [Cytophagales bacterium]HAP62475.1 hypothetical protein [Cytophagales bacterium]
MSQESAKLFKENYLTNLQAMQVMPESIQLLRQKAKVVLVKSKHTLIMPGEINKNVYLVIEGGFVCRYIHETTGEAKTINFYLQDLHPVMACVDSYFTQVPTHCELKAVTDSVVLATPKMVMDQIVAEDLHFANFHHQVVNTAMVEENELKMKLIAYSAKEKYDFIIEEMPSVIQKVPSKYIAEFCGISPEWLSKLKKQNG